MKPENKFLLASAAGVLNTVNARKPLARSGGGSVPSFASGWLTSELPLHTVAWQALATAWFGARHGFSSPQAKAALALNVASWAALVEIHREAARVDGVLESALREGLGPAYRHAEPRGRAPIDTTTVLQPFANGRKTYGVATDLSYGDAGRRNQLDVWRRRDLPSDAGAPVLLQVHGGGWTIGNKEQQGGPIMTHMCEQGWVCVAINYRLSPRATWPDHIVDVKRGIAWVRENIARYGGDPDFIAITGGSAGGHLASVAALTPDAAAFQPGFEDVDTALQAAVPVYGVYDFRNRDGSGRDDMKDMLERMVLKVPEQAAPEVWEGASPIALVRPDAPPFMVVHGVNDSLAPVEQARSFVAALRETSTSPVVYAELPGAQHAFEVFRSLRAQLAVWAMGDFLTHVHTSIDLREAGSVRRTPVAG